MVANPKLSVIIPTRNRSALLGNALNSLITQQYPKDDFEVIVIDNGSVDDTKAVVDSFIGKLNIYYQYNNTPGLHVGRHVGLNNARADILVYADDDIEAYPTWLEAIYESFQDGNVVLVGGKNLPKYEIPPPFWILQKWYNLMEYGHCVGELRILDFGDEIKEIDPLYVFGCNFSIRKRIVLEAGGFHPDSMPFELIRYRGDGETHVSNYIAANKLKTIYNPAASVYHLVTKDRLTVDYFCKEAFSQGISDSFTELRKNKGLRKPNDGYKKMPVVKKLLSQMFCNNKLLKKIEQKIVFSETEKMISRAYQAGFSYHQKMVIRDKKLAAWVFREDYF